VKRRAQRGAALLAAMLTVTLVATLAAGALWQQWRSVEVEEAERTRLQASWILTGALDWARLILREDRGIVDHLGEPWAVPLQEARLSTFLAADQSNNTDNTADQTFLSGQITDLQSFLNLGGLVEPTGGNVNANALQAFRRLFELLGLPQEQLERLAENLRFASDLSPDNRSLERAALPPGRLEQLAWLGVPPETVKALQPYVTVLPGNERKVNLNTASAEVIYAIGKDYSLADAQRLVAARAQQHFTVESNARRLLPTGSEFLPNMAGVGSTYFQVRGRLRIGEILIEEVSIVQKLPGTRGLADVKTLQRERVVLPATEAAPAR